MHRCMPPGPLPAGRQLPVAGRAGARRGPGARGELHLFAGFLRCADCGRAMTRKTARGLVYYTCSTYRRKSKTACTKHTIREDRLRTLTAQALGVAAEDLTRGLLFARVEEICVQEGGEIAVHPLQTGGE